MKKKFKKKIVQTTKKYNNYIPISFSHLKKKKKEKISFFYGSSWRSTLSQSQLFFGFSEKKIHQNWLKIAYTNRINENPNQNWTIWFFLWISMDRVLVASYPINQLIRPRSFRIDYCWSSGFTFRLSPVKERQKLSKRWRWRSMASDSTDSSSSFAPSMESDPSDKNSAR